MSEVKQTGCIIELTLETWRTIGEGLKKLRTCEEIVCKVGHRIAYLYPLEEFIYSMVKSNDPLNWYKGGDLPEEGKS